MSKVLNTQQMAHATQLAGFIAVLNAAHAGKVTLQTGRKFDKIFIGGAIRYFVVKTETRGFIPGDILGAKSLLAPNFKWYFGTLTNHDKWNWEGYHGRPVEDDTVVEVKGYGPYKHYKKVK